jgi:alkaline phosphatase
MITLIAGVLGAACAKEVVEPPPPPPPPPNVVLVIGDGFGAGAWSLAREWARTRGEELVLDHGSAVGFLEVHAGDALVTDSGAAATAWSTGRLGPRFRVGPAEGEEVIPLFERLRAAGRAFGLATTSRITHATPAGFYARVPDREREDEIAVQLLDARPDVAIGGGRRHFRPRAAGGSRTDGRDLLSEAEADGIAVRSELAGPLPVDRPVLALLAESHLPHELDREEDEPDLAELAVAAVRRLEATGRSWFLLVEEGRIDSAAHDHDGPGLALNTVRLDRAVRALIEVTDRERTLVVVGSDHATASPVFLEFAHPESLEVVTASIERMAERIFEGRAWRGTPAELEEKAIPILDRGARHTGLRPETLDGLITAANRYDRRAVLGTAVSRRFGIAFLPCEDQVASAEVHGHTGEPVPVRAWGPRASEVAGVRDHGELGRWIAEVLELPPAAAPDSAAESADSVSADSASIDSDAGGG